MSEQDLSLGDLLESAGATLVHGDPSLRISNVHYDSRQIRPGGMFVALRGGYVDGHLFLADSLDNGAVAALVEDSTGA
jgi:UDP-N-acetylmuramoyl-L-alanyl-D-glutamate--2,6-diaminopimelate ligase